MCMSSRISGRNRAIAPKLRPWKLWQKITSVTVIGPSRLLEVLNWTAGREVGGPTLYNKGLTASSGYGPRSGHGFEHQGVRGGCEHGGIAGPAGPRKGGAGLGEEG